MINLLSRLFLFLLLPFFCFAESDRLREVTFFSNTLQKQMTYGISIPEKLTPEDRFPVVYYLHGFGRNHRTAIEEQQADLTAERFRLIVVFVDAGNSWYLDSPVDPASQYETYITKDLIPEVDGAFPTVAEANARGIMGWSMGGNGALILAAKHPELFGVASSMSGIFDLTQHPEQWEIAQVLGPYSENPERWKNHSAYYLADQLIANQTSILFDSGTEDVGTLALYHARDLHALLVKKNAPHIFREIPGNHHDAYWAYCVGEHLSFHQAMMVEFVPGLKSYETHCFERLQLFAQENARVNEADEETSSVMLLGSSSCEAFPAELLPGYTVINRGIGSDVLGIGNRGLLRHMELSIFDQQPDAIMFEMGVNDLGDLARNGTPAFEEIPAAFRTVVEQIRFRLPETTLILMRCTPVNGKYAHLAENIDRYNLELEKIAAEFDLLMLDNHSPFRNEAGLLKEEFTHDGLHLNAEAMQMWADVMKAGLLKSGVLPVIIEEPNTNIGSVFTIQ